MSKKTTDLARLQNGAPYTWGDVLEIHHVGPYHIVEFAWNFAGSEDDGTIGYTPYVHGKDTCHGYKSLDAALSGAIAYAHEGPNHHADEYFMKMIGEDLSCQNQAKPQ